MFIKNRRLFAYVILSAMISSSASAMFPPQNYQAVRNYMGRVLGASWRAVKRPFQRCGNACLNKSRACLRRTAREVNENLVEPIVRPVEQRVLRPAQNVMANAQVQVNNAQQQVNVIGNNAQQHFNRLIFKGVFGVAALVSTWYISKIIWEYIEKKYKSKKSQSKEKTKESETKSAPKTA